MVAHCQLDPVNWTKSVKLESKYRNSHSIKCIGKLRLKTSAMLLRLQYVNSLSPSVAIWRHRTWSTLIQVMACCLTAPSHYLNQYGHLVSKVLEHSSEGIIIRRAEDNNQYDKIGNCILTHFPLVPHICTYMWQWIGWALVQIMACRLSGAKPLSKPMMGYRQLDA